MDYYGRFRRAAIEHGFPAEEVDAFAGFLRFTIWAHIRHNGLPVGHPEEIPTGLTADVPVGRAGGLPRLPVGMPWPTGPNGPLPFVASFDCAALPKIDGIALPPDGSLLIFLHHESAHEAFDRVKEQRYARIVYVPADTGTVVADEPDHPGRTFTTNREFVSPERDLFAVVHAELPEWLDKDDAEDEDLEDGPGFEAEMSDFQRQVARGLPHRRELYALVGRLWPDTHYAAFQFGGYTWDIGEMYTDHLLTTPELTIAAEKLKAREKAGDLVIPPEQKDFLLEEELQRVMREWVPLVQFHPGDAHVARFLIRVDDLAAHRFDQAISWTAFTK